MLKSLVGLILAILLTFSIELVVAEEISKKSSDYDFRRIKWGMSQEEVTSAEPSTPISKDKYEILYKTVILKNNMSLIYRFYNDKLIGATYQLEDKYPRTEYYMDTYNEFNDALKNKYGDAIKNEIVWLDNTFKNNPDKKKFALSAGHLQYFSSWLTDKTRIKSILFGEFHNLILKINYISIMHEEISKREEIIKDPL